MKLTIIIPVFNEKNTISEIIKRVKEVKITGFEKEIIIVDDGSTDGTTDEVLKSIKGSKIIFLQHKNNAGKGAAIKTGVSEATGDYIIIQDADLEYNPKDIEKLTSPIRENQAEVVYGTRLNRFPNLKRDEKTFQFLIHYFGNRFLSFLTSVLYGQWLTDMETCYKLFPRKALTGINLNSHGFDFEPEITAKLLKKGYKILELPITTTPRGYGEGKKLNTIRDGTIALYTLIKYRFLK